MLAKVLTAQDVTANEIRAQAITNFDLKKPYPIPYIKRATQMGIIDIAFTQQMMALPEDIDLRTLEYQDPSDGLWKPVMTIKVLPS